MKSYPEDFEFKNIQWGLLFPSVVHTSQELCCTLSFAQKDQRLDVSFQIREMFYLNVCWCTPSPTYFKDEISLFSTHIYHFYNSQFHFWTDISFHLPIFRTWSVIKNKYSRIHLSTGLWLYSMCIIVIMLSS